MGSAAILTFGCLFNVTRWLYIADFRGLRFAYFGRWCDGKLHTTRLMHDRYLQQQRIAQVYTVAAEAVV